LVVARVGVGPAEGLERDDGAVLEVADRLVDDREPVALGNPI
jgi:hypothetical protein